MSAAFARCASRLARSVAGARRALVPVLAAVLAAILVAACGTDDRCGGARPPSDLPRDHVLLNPDTALLRQLPPDSFDVRFVTSQGEVVVRVHRDWSPLGVYRFYNLARNGFYDGSYFFRVIPGFVAQFGVSGQPQVDRLWHDTPIPDDPRRLGISNRTGTLTYARAGPDSRATQLFFNFGDNIGLDEQGFTPIGRVIDGMPALYRLHGDYGDMQPQGRGPDFGCILSHGNRYLERRYPRLDRIERVEVDG
jgi:peptidyl-prolyl cis-trans isomerase A (cyclophilin A)